MPLDDARQNEPKAGKTDIVGAAEGKVQSALIVLEHLDEVVIGRMNEKWHAQLFDPVVERLEPWVVDTAVLADRAWNVDS
jgi:hypothetical protein